MAVVAEPPYLVVVDHKNKQTTPMIFSRFIATSITFCLLATAAHAQSAEGFSSWLDDFKSRAAAQGIQSSVIEGALTGVELNERVLALDQKQPEGKISFTQYLRNTVSPERIRKGREMMLTHHAVLKKISNQYGVPAKYIVALWGIESNYSGFQGNFSVVESLATLAYEGRRAEFFSNELLAALKIITVEKIEPSTLTGSWAGAMGGCQFMPSTYLKYAADGDGDGHRDIWQNPADVMASTANYLSGLGWDKSIAWGKNVKFPDDFKTEEADIKHARSKDEWRKRGIKLAGGKTLPGANINLYAIYPGTPDEGEYLVSENFQRLLQWNYSRYFATAVGILADHIGDPS